MINIRARGARMRFARDGNRFHQTLLPPVTRGGLRSPFGAKVGEETLSTLFKVPCAKNSISLSRCSCVPGRDGPLIGKVIWKTETPDVRQRTICPLPWATVVVGLYLRSIEVPECPHQHRFLVDIGI